MDPVALWRALLPCPACGRRPTGRVGACAPCWDRWLPTEAPPSTPPLPGTDLPTLIALGPYRGGLGRLVRAGKYRPDQALLDALGTALGERVARRLPRDDTCWHVVPAPADPRRRRRRGDDHAARLAHAVARVCGPRARFEPVLRRLRTTATQAGSSRAVRARNLEGVIGCVPSVDLRLASVVLVDDVLTTGATARACAAALRHVGAHRIVVAVVARSR